MCEILCFLFLLSISLNILYLSAFLNIPQKKTENIHRHGVSIIVAARNELENLKKLLPCLLSQKYPLYEIIIADDRSEDDSISYLQEIQKSNQNLRVVQIKDVEKHLNPKKNALTYAIHAAHYDYLIFTDADCLPCSELWIESFMNKFDENTDIVLAYSPYFSENTFLNLLIRFETFFTAIQYFSAAFWGIPYMGVGRNLAYRKEIFVQNSGFENHKYVKSGDDDLFVGQMANAKNTAWNLGMESLVFSYPKKSWRDWFRQKQRHLTAGHHYKFYHRLLIGTFILSLLFFYVGTLLFANKFVYLLILRWVLAFLVWKHYKRLLHEKISLLLMPFLECVFVFTYFVIGISSLFNQVKWKN